MSLFGYFGHKSADEVILAAKKQKMAGKLAIALINPLGFVVREGTTILSGERGQSVSDEQYVKAIILKVMRDNDLLPDTRFRNKLRQMVKEILAEEKITSIHPHWNISNFRHEGINSAY